VEQVAECLAAAECPAAEWAEWAECLE